MSAGTFEEGRYAAGNTFIYPVRVQPETKELELDSVANAYPAGTATANIGTLTLSKGKRAFGVIPRTVTVEFTADGAGATSDYEGVGASVVIPVFQQSVWEGYSKGQTGTYLGVAVKCTFKSPEIVR